jgi:hypothetical protein
MKPQASQIPTSLVFLVVMIGVVNGLAEAHHWYWVYRWFDMPMHFAGGVWLAGMALWWHFYRNNIATQSFVAALIPSLIAALGVGLAWEVYEASISLVTVGHINDMRDTLSDLLFDILGGTAVAVGVNVRRFLK